MTHGKDGRTDRGVGERTRRSTEARDRSDSQSHVAFGSQRGPYWRVGTAVRSLAIACAVTAGCSGDDGSEASSSSTEVVIASTTSTTTVEAAVLDGYRAFWAAYLRAADPMNPEHPDLSATATGQQLEQVQRAFLARLAGGEVIRGTIETHPHLDGAVGGTTATVVDCATDDSHVFDAASGAQKDDAETVTHQLRADMVLVDETWKVSAINIVSDGCTPS